MRRIVSGAAGLAMLGSTLLAALPATVASAHSISQISRSFNNGHGSDLDLGDLIDSLDDDCGWQDRCDNDLDLGDLFDDYDDCDNSCNNDLDLEDLFDDYDDCDNSCDNDCGCDSGNDLDLGDLGDLIDALDDGDEGGDLVTVESNPTTTVDVNVTVDNQSNVDVQQN